MSEEKYNVHNFIEEYKDKWISYCEVIIDPYGLVYIARPSHQETLIRLAMNKLKVTRDELNNLVPREYYFDMITWLTMQTKCVAVWYDSLHYNKLTRYQKRTLNLLKENGMIDKTLIVR